MSKDEIKELEEKLGARITELEKKCREEQARAGRLEETKRNLESRISNLENYREEQLTETIKKAVKNELRKNEPDRSG